MTSLFLLAVGICAGIANAVVGGGQFLTFPAFVMAGVPSVLANTTSSVAVFPGIVTGAYAFRKDVLRLADLVDIKGSMAMSLAGGLLGALLLTHTPEAAFAALVPWLLLFGTLVYAFGNRLNLALRRSMRLGSGGFLATQFLIGIYGGYFGAGIGILMLALLGVYGITDLHAMSGFRTLQSSCINAVAVLTFVLEGQVDWPGAVAMGIGAIIGGYTGAAVARRISAKVLRPVIIVIAFAMTGYFFLR